MVLQRDDHRVEALLSQGLVFTVEDVAYLGGDAGERALAAVAGLALNDATLVADVARVRREFGGRAAVLIETTLLRRRAANEMPGAKIPWAKIPNAGRWLLTDEALQQATAAPVAAHRAARLRGRAVHDLTCSVGAELAALRDTATVLVGSDIDPVRVAMARHNVPDVPVCVADALRPVSRAAVLVADPARRVGGRRRFDPRDYRPPLDGLLAAADGRDLAVKCAPGIDFAAVRALGFAGEIEVTSVAGGVREACLWSPGLAEPAVRRRATLLDRGEQVTDADPEDCPVAPAGRWIVDPDGAVVRAGLVRHWAARHGLWQLDPDIAYLSGDRLPAGVRGIEVIDRIDFSERRLRDVLAAHDAGAVEILVRGVAVDPDALRPRLRLSGAARRSVVITRIGTGAAGRAVAYLGVPSW